MNVNEVNKLKKESEDSINDILSDFAKKTGVNNVKLIGECDFYKFSNGEKFLRLLKSEITF